VGVRPDGAGWRCHVCGEAGDAATLASWVLFGRRLPANKAEWGELGGRLLGADAPKPTPRATAPTGPIYPPEEEVRALLDQAASPDLDTMASLWLTGRRLAPGLVVDRVPGVRALPQGATVPRWARCCGQSWTTGGWTLVAPLYDAAGEIRSVHARKVSDGEPKGAVPADYSSAGLVLADGLAVALLRGDPAVKTQVLRASSGCHGAGLVICEGLPDWTCECCRYSDADEDAPAVVGISSGSWTRAHVDTIPDGCTVRIATDDDAPGETHAEKIAATFKGRRVKLLRWRPGSVQKEDHNGQ